MTLRFSKLLRSSLWLGVILSVIFLFSENGYVSRWTGLSFSYLLGALLLPIGFLLVADIIAMIDREPVESFLLRWRLIRLVVVRGDPSRLRLFLMGSPWLLRAVAGLTLLYAGLNAAPRIAETVAAHPGGRALEGVLPYILVLEDMAPWALSLTGVFVLVHAAGRIWPALGYITPFPAPQLIVLAIGYCLLAQQGVFRTAFGFEGSFFLLAAAVAMGMAYLADFLLGSSSLLEEPSLRSSRMGQASLWLDLLSRLARVISGAALVWGVLSTLPSVSSTLLANDTAERFGVETFPYFAALFDVRYLAPGLWSAWTIAWRIPLETRLKTPVLSG